jgi:hypothetical protein
MSINDLKPTQFALTAVSPQLWKVAFNNPPVNVLGPAMIKDLKDLLTRQTRW